MSTDKMVAISPDASSLIALVAENPAMSEGRIRQLLSYIDTSQRDIVEQVVRLIRERSSGDVAPGGDLPTGDTRQVAEEIADAYIRWARENASDSPREERRKSSVM